MTVYDLLVDFTIASALILVGQFLRAKIKFFQEFFMPASMIAGFLGLFLQCSPFFCKCRFLYGSADHHYLWCCWT